MTMTEDDASAPSLDEFQQRFAGRPFPSTAGEWRFRDTDPASGRIPLVFLPGAGGTGDVFYRVADAIRHDRRVITITYPAVDDSTALVTGLAELLDEVGSGGGADLCGSSLGGYLVQRLALEAPAKLRRCMLASTFHDPAWLQRKISREAVAATTPADFMASTVAKLVALPEGGPEATDYKHTMLALAGTQQTAEAGRASLLAVLGASPLPPMPVDPTAIAVLDAEDDPAVDGPTRDALRERYAASRQYHLRSGGHYPFLLNPGEFGAAIAHHFTG